MTVKEFYDTVDGINICRIGSWNNYIKFLRDCNYEPDSPYMNYVNLSCIDLDVVPSFGLVSNEVLELYGDKTIHTVDIESVGGRILANIYVEGELY